MHRQFDYRGHRVQTTVLPDQGRWAYRIDEDEMHTSKDVRLPAKEEVLFAEAEKAARAHIDGAERRRVFRAERDAGK
ncbi:hypothetical protein GCM10028796_02310 [Ramlibacter monticola]|uniref:Uncharacterized protein n=1 Tax=Ramlibacter monticola TaxID=1926872 RepID=A0A936Z0E1_9BURK|nr:hypothetical protein [Ramlibacter monticola]MBL0391481.1 hypothetical protein [Ramlibacter monticola]